MAKLSKSEQVAAIKTLIGKQIVFLTFANSDMVGLKLDDGRVVHVPNEDILQIIA